MCSAEPPLSDEPLSAALPAIAPSHIDSFTRTGTSVRIASAGRPAAEAPRDGGAQGVRWATEGGRPAAVTRGGS